MTKFFLVIVLIASWHCVIKPGFVVTIATQRRCNQCCNSTYVNIHVKLQSIIFVQQDKLDPDYST